MYIAPNSKIILLKNCPLDTTYDHTIYFYDTTGQYNYFYGLRKYSFTEQTYQRLNRGVLRIARVADDLYDCNYLMFQNSSYGNKWFYAFITSVEYVNNSVSEIRYQIDVMQTWFFDYTLDQCFVEREHTITDAIGEHLVSENFEHGTYTNRPIGMLENYFEPGLENYYIVIACSETRTSGTWQAASGAMYCGLYSGVQYYSCETAAIANSFLGLATTDNKADSIVAVFMMPKAFFNSDGTVSTNIPKSIAGYMGRPATFNYGGETYTPRNNKLLTYPYNFLTIVNSDGDKEEYKWEFCPNGEMNYNIYGALNVTPEFMFVPTSYNGMTNNRLNGMFLTSAPQCAYAIDGYRAWFAQRRYPMALASAGALGQMATGIGQIAAGGMIGGADLPLPESNIQVPMYESAARNQQSMSRNYTRSGGGNYTRGFSAAMGLLAANAQAETLPATLRGSNSNVISLGLGWYGFHAFATQLKPEFAKIIDDFFDRFGYAIHRNKIPNRYARENWTYTKTISCTITGSVPADDAKAICSIYDHGITFWANGNNVGNYSLSNRPMGS